MRSCNTIIPYLLACRAAAAAAADTDTDADAMSTSVMTTCSVRKETAESQCVRERVRKEVSKAQR